MSTIRDKAPRIVVGVDGSPSSRSALAWAVRQARLTGGTVDAVIAWQIPASVTGFGWTIPMPDTGFDEIAKQTLAEAMPRECFGSPQMLLQLGLSRTAHATARRPVADLIES